MSVPQAPQGPMPALGIPEGQDYPRLVYTAPYFDTVPLAELIEPAVTEAVEAALPGLVPPYVDQAANAAVQQLAVLLAGSTMQGPLFLNPVMPTQPAQAASMAYVDAMIATAGVPEVPATPIGQTWARQVGQWVPISEEGGNFLPITGGTMQGQINMSGNAIVNLPALPVMPNGAAPAQWVLNQISSVSLYQGTWDMDTYTPDLTQLSTHVNGWTWIATTTSASGVVIAPAIPGLQGKTIFNGDTVIFSSTAGAFQSIHSGGLSLPEAQALFLALAGGQMSGPLMLNANATSAMEPVTYQQFTAAIGGFVTPDAPGDGQAYLRVGLTQSWTAGLPLAGGSMTGQLLLSGNATNALGAVTLQQLNATLSSGFVAISGATMTGLLVLSGNATNPFNPVPLSQLNSMLGGYLSTTGGSINGTLTVGAAGAGTPAPLTVGGQGISYSTVGASGQNLAFGYASGQLAVYQNGAAVPLGYLPLSGGILTNAADILAGGTLVTSMPATIGGTIIGRVVAGGSNLSIGCYADASTIWRQLPGTGTGISNPVTPVVFGSGGGNLDISVASAGADGAALSLIGIAVLGTTVASFPGEVASTSVSIGGLAPIVNTGGYLNPQSSIVIPATASYGCGAPGNQVSWSNNAAYFFTSSTLCAQGGLACGTPGNVVTWSNNAGYMYCPNSLSVYSIVVGNGLAGASTFWAFQAGYMYCQSSVMANAFVDSSDPQVKTNVSNYTEGVSIISQMQPIHFQYNGLGGTQDDVALGVTRIGFDASQVQPLVPQAVMSSQGKLRPDDTEEVPLLAINTTMLVPVLVSAIKQLINRIAALEAAVDITPPAADTA